MWQKGTKQFYTEIALTPLHLASEQGHHIDLVKYLVIEQEINQLCEDDYGNTPLHRAYVGGLLHYAAAFGHLHIVKYLTDKQGCNPSCLDENKCIQLHYAAINGHMDIVKFFTVRKHCDPMCISQDSNQDTPLHRAAEELGLCFQMKMRLHSIRHS